MIEPDPLDTRVSLRVYIEALIREQDARNQVRWQETDKAVVVAETATRERLEKHNGLIAMMRENADEFARKGDLAAHSRRIDELSTRVYWLMGVSAAAGAVAGAVFPKIL